MTRFPIRYAGWMGAVLRAVLVPQRSSYVDVSGDRVRVRLGWGFSSRFARSNVAHVSREKSVWVTAGAHGWRGRWLVNGARGPIVGIKLRGPARGRALVFPVKVREVQISVDDPDALIAALQ